MIPEEFSRISKDLNDSEYGFLLEPVYDLDLRASEIQRLLRKHKPSVLHFSGHFDESGRMYLLKEDSTLYETVDLNLLEKIIKTHSKKIEFVFLNACNSAQAAEVLLNYVDCIVAMKGSVNARACVEFASTFYNAVGFGDSVQESFVQGQLEISLLKIREEEKPVLFERKPGVAEKLFLLPQRR